MKTAVEYENSNEEEAITNDTITCMDAVTGDCTDELIEEEALVEKNCGVDFDNYLKEPKEATDENLNGPSSQDKSPSPESERVGSNKDSSTESNVLHEQEDDAFEEYDVEKVIRKQKSHCLICPHCKKKITRTVILVKRRRRKIHGGGHKGKKPSKSKAPVSETTEIDIASDKDKEEDDDDDPVPAPGDQDSDPFPVSVDQDSDTKPEDEIITPPLAPKDEDHKGEGKGKADSDQAATIIDGKLKSLVRDIRQRFCSVPPLRFLYMLFALLFLLMLALWFLSTSPLEFPSISPEQFPSIPHPPLPSFSSDQLSSTSSLWFLSILALFSLAILAPRFPFSPYRNKETDGKNADSISSDHGKAVADSGEPKTLPNNRTKDEAADADADGKAVSGPEFDFHEKPGKINKPSSHLPSHASPMDKEGKHTQPYKEEASPPQESEEHALKPRPAAATKTVTDPNNLSNDKTKSEEIPIHVPEKRSKIEILKSIVYGGLIEFSDKIEILKSIVYGGLIESITSLGIVSSAAGSGASTLNILVMGFANLGSGIMLIVHTLIDLKSEKPRNAEEDRYEQLIGRREKFRLHIVVVILSFIVFGVIPPLVYGVSFRGTDQRRYKAAAVLVVSLVCVVSLAIAKAYVSKPREYLKTVFRYTKLAIGASGISYILGDIVNDLLEKYGFYDDSAEIRRG